MQLRIGFIIITLITLSIQGFAADPQPPHALPTDPVRDALQKLTSTDAQEQMQALENLRSHPSLLKQVTDRASLFVTTRNMNANPQVSNNQKMAVTALLRITEHIPAQRAPLLGTFMDATAGGSPDTRAQAFEGLKRCATEINQRPITYPPTSTPVQEVGSRLVGLLESPDPELQKQASTVLTILKPKGPLVNEAILRISNPQALATLKTLLHPEGIQSVAQTMGNPTRLKTERGQDDFVQLLLHPDPELKKAAQETFKNQKPSPAGLQERILISGSSELLSLAQTVYGKDLRTDTRTVERAFQLSSALTASDTRSSNATREASLRFLEQLGTENPTYSARCVDALSSGLTSGDSSIQEEALKSIRKVVSSSTSNDSTLLAAREYTALSILPLLNSSVEGVQKEVRATLRTLRPKDADFRHALAARDDSSSVRFSKEYFGSTWAADVTQSRLGANTGHNETEAAQWIKNLDHKYPEIQKETQKLFLKMKLDHPEMRLALLQSRNLNLYAFAEQTYGQNWIADTLQSNLKFTPQKWVDLLKDPNEQVRLAAEKAIRSINPQSEAFKKAVVESRDQNVFTFAKSLFNTQWETILNRYQGATVLNQRSTEIPRDSKTLSVTTAKTRLAETEEPHVRTTFLDPQETQDRLGNGLGQTIVHPSGKIERVIGINSQGKVFEPTLAEEGIIHTQQGKNAEGGDPRFFTQPPDTLEAYAKRAQGLPVPQPGIPIAGSQERISVGDIPELLELQKTVERSINPAMNGECNLLNACQPAVDLTRLPPATLKTELIQQLRPALRPEAQAAFEKDIGKRVDDYFYRQNRPQLGFNMNLLSSHVAHSFASSILQGTDGFETLKNPEVLMESATFSAAYTVQNRALNQWIFKAPQAKPIIDGIEMLESMKASSATPKMNGRWISRHAASMAVSMEIMTLSRLLREDPEKAKAYLLKGQGLRDTAVGAGTSILPRAFISPAVKNISSALRNLERLRQGMKVCKAPAGAAALAETVIEETAIIFASMLLQGWVEQKVYPFFERQKVQKDLNDLNRQMQSNLEKERQSPLPSLEAGRIPAVQQSLKNDTFFVPIQNLGALASGSVQEIHQKFDQSREAIKSSYLAKLSEYTHQRAKISQGYDAHLPDYSNFLKWKKNQDRWSDPDFVPELYRKKAADLKKRDEAFLESTRLDREKLVGTPTVQLEWESDARTLLDGHPEKQSRFKNEKDLMRFLVQLPSSLHESYLKEQYYLNLLAKQSKTIASEQRKKTAETATATATRLPDLEAIQIQNLLAVE